MLLNIVNETVKCEEMEDELPSKIKVLSVFQCSFFLLLLLPIILASMCMY